MCTYKLSFIVDILKIFQKLSNILINHLVTLD